MVESPGWKSATTANPLFVPINQLRDAIGTSVDSMAIAVGETADGIDAIRDSPDADEDADAEEDDEVEEDDEDDAADSDAEAEVGCAAPPILLRYSNLANSFCCSAVTVGAGSSSLADTAVISSSSEKRLEQLARSGCAE